MKLLLNACTARKQIGLPPGIKKAVLAAAAVADPDAPLVTDKKGEQQPDPDLRDNETSTQLPVWGFVVAQPGTAELTGYVNACVAMLQDAWSALHEHLDDAALGDTGEAGFVRTT